MHKLHIKQTLLEKEKKKRMALLVDNDDDVDEDKFITFMTANLLQVRDSR